MMICLVVFWSAIVLPTQAKPDGTDGEFLRRVTHAYADSDGVKIHFVSVGKGPLIVFVHGFPDFWYTWRHQMDALSNRFRCVALDTRGYNKSDKPDGVSEYAMSLLMDDVEAVIKANGETKAIIVGHDWGGAIAWNLAMHRPQLVERLVICNLPHPNGVQRELATNKSQQVNSQYARRFQEPDSHKRLSAEGLARMRSNGDEKLLATFRAAFEASEIESMMNYYKANYPSELSSVSTQVSPMPLPKVNVPVLMFHGLEDKALHHHGLNNTWEWLNEDLMLVTVPGVGHWVHEDAEELVTETMGWWLTRKATR